MIPYALSPSFRFPHLKQIEHSVYDGIITIENTEIEYPLRVHQSECSQLILRFDDITFPVDDWVEPSTKHIEEH